jgi:hypothetical protein
LRALTDSPPVVPPSDQRESFIDVVGWPAGGERVRWESFISSAPYAMLVPEPKASFFAGCA